MTEAGKPIKEIYEEAPTKIGSPEKFTFRNVMYWEPRSAELLKLKQDGGVESATLLSKSKSFLEHDCIIKMGNGMWVCNPIKGYNKTAYVILVDPHKKEGLACGCQGFNNNEFCSHCLAVKQWEFINEKNAE